MAKIINFNIVNQYKLLYIIPTSGNRFYHVWGRNMDELQYICKLIKIKYNLKHFHFGLISGDCRIKKEFKPTPNYLRKQPDGFYHAYFKFTNMESIEWRN